MYSSAEQQSAVYTHTFQREEQSEQLYKDLSVFTNTPLVNS